MKRISNRLAAIVAMASVALCSPVRADPDPPDPPFLCAEPTGTCEVAGIGAQLHLTFAWQTAGLTDPAAARLVISAHGAGGASPRLKVAAASGLVASTPGGVTLDAGAEVETIVYHLAAGPAPASVTVPLITLVGAGAGSVTLGGVIEQDGQQLGDYTSPSIVVQ